MKNELKNILVDLTPVLPGGENGGAKLFVLELIKYLAKNNPDTNFVLLTQSKAYEELAFLDRHNVSRVMLESSTGRKSILSRLVGYVFRKIPYIPKRFSLYGYRLYTKLRQRNLRNVLTNFDYD